MRKFLILFLFCMFQVNGMLTCPPGLNSLRGCFRGFCVNAVKTTPSLPSIAINKEKKKEWDKRYRK